ncbi:lytic transglycosylase domain-containing protein [Roseomonas sp. 18066]|uniref:lytic transglycosylase domain-containing protein n=1 Tax=Roseomonas sp. 18066 TaxID=2681412 RepID=UPI00135BE9FB|nr:lytic transglycosylase domain-containing protein [Roseomonas sp. 18066]
MPLLGLFLGLFLALAGPAAARGIASSTASETALARPADPAPGGLCRTAISVVEREFNIPQHLLAAIGRVESGTRGANGRPDPYPWTINAEGKGAMFPSKAAVIAHVQNLQAGGMRSIDTGCMQINLRHHPNAFASLEDAFDPLTNVRYAAKFLTDLYTARGDWSRAAAAYHSQNPEFAEPYLARIQAAWRAEQQNPAPPPSGSQLAALQAPERRGAPAGPPVAMPVVGGGIPMTASAAAASPGGGFLNNGADRVQVAMAAPGSGGGRGLDAYRGAPIAMVATRRAAPLLTATATTTAAARSPMAAVRPLF